MKPRARHVVFGFSALLALSAPAAAAADANAGADAWAGLEVLDDSDLADMRGGIAIMPGVDIGFGAVVTTYADGSPVLSTQLTWTDAGAIVDQTISLAGANIEAMSPEALAALGLDGVAGGVIITDAEGVTTLVHNVTDGALQNIILNDANGRDIRQTVDITLTLPNFEAMQSALTLERLGMSLSADLAHAAFVGGE
jgi:hypothetical protein